MDSGIKSQVASSSWTNEEPIWMGELTKLGGGGGIFFTPVGTKRGGPVVPKKMARESDPGVERCGYWHHFGAFFINFEQISHIVFPLLALNN